MNKVEDSLWKQYCEKGDMGARTQLLNRHLGLVHHIARQFAARLPNDVELDDLVSAGSVGLILALESFEPARALAFSTYATPRIRGAIIDDLRSRDWVPRSVRSKSRRMSEAVSQLEAALGRTPEPIEVATVLGIELETYWKWVEDTGNAVLFPFDGKVGNADSESVTLGETLSDASVSNPDEAIAHSEQVESLREAINELPVKERTVLSLYYYEELNLRQIAEVLMLTESRISQIRSRALQRLKARLRAEEVTA